MLTLKVLPLPLSPSKCKQTIIDNDCSTIKLVSIRNGELHKFVKLFLLFIIQIRASSADEDPGSVFGKGVAFFLGEPCDSTCNRILFNVFCNQTTRRCECLPEFPVNVDNKYCVKGLSHW